MEKKLDVSKKQAEHVADGLEAIQGASRALESYLAALLDAHDLDGVWNVVDCSKEPPWILVRSVEDEGVPDYDRPPD